MPSTWILVVDRVHARLLAPTEDGGALIALENFVNPNGCKPDRANSHGRLSRMHESARRLAAPSNRELAPSKRRNDALPANSTTYWAE